MSEQLRKYKVSWTTGANFIGHYKGKVTVFAEDADSARSNAIREVKRNMQWKGFIYTTDVIEVTQ